MSFANYSFRFSDDIELRFMGLSVASVEADVVAKVKQRIDGGENDTIFPVIEDGESFYLYTTEYGNLLLIRTFEVARSRDGAIVQSDRGAAYERFESDQELTEYLKDHVEVDNPDCPFRELLEQWGQHSVVEQLMHKKRVKPADHGS